MTPMQVWAGTGSVAAPDNTKISQGWELGEKPPHEWMNWWQNGLNQQVNHLLKNGINNHETTISYPAGALVRDASGDIWQAVSPNINAAPPNAAWRRATRDASTLAFGTVPNARISGNYTGFGNITGSGNLTMSGNATVGGALTVSNSATATRFKAATSAGAGDPAFGWGNGSGMFWNGGDSSVRFSVLTNEKLRITDGAVQVVGGAIFSGNGSSLTNLNASNLSSGTVPNGRINGPGLTNLNASELASGSVPNARLTGTYNNIAHISVSGNISAAGNLSGNGSSITALNASNISSGTLSIDRLPDQGGGAGAWVGRQYAVLGTTAVGSIVFARHTGSGLFGLGDTTGGNNLVPSNAEGGAVGSTLQSGTQWACLGRISSASEDDGRTCCWQRVS